MIFFNAILNLRLSRTRSNWKKHPVKFQNKSKIKHCDWRMRSHLCTLYLSVSKQSARWIKTNKHMRTWKRATEWAGYGASTSGVNPARAFLFLSLNKITSLKVYNSNHAILSNHTLLWRFSIAIQKNWCLDSPTYNSKKCENAQHLQPSSSYSCTPTGLFIVCPSLTSCTSQSAQ